MAKDPAFLFYSNDFLADIADLNWDERGRYITLVCLQHQKGHLSEKTICLSIGLHTLNHMPDLCKKFAKDEEGLYYIIWLDELISARKKYADSRRENGKNGGRPKKESIDKPYGSEIESIQKAYKNLPENENVNEDKDEKEEGGMGETGATSSSTFHFPGKPKFTDIPDPPAHVLQAVAEVQARKHMVFMRNPEILEHWRSWLPINVTGVDTYENLDKVYKHFSNSTALQPIKNLPKNGTTANRVNHGTARIDSNKNFYERRT